MASHRAGDEPAASSDEGPVRIVRANVDPEADTIPVAADQDEAAALPPTREAFEAACVERDEYRDLLLRKTAEFDNYRKRVERERRDQAAAGVSEVLESLLPILDDFERARAVETPANDDAYREGIELIHRQLVDLLARRGVIPIQAVRGAFDPRFHQAVLTEASPDHRDGEVIEEFRRGYLLGDRLLRPAMVKVAKT
jgi:molecular chaperone GrpE